VTKQLLITYFIVKISIASSIFIYVSLSVVHSHKKIDISPCSCYNIIVSPRKLEKQFTLLSECFAQQKERKSANKKGNKTQTLQLIIQ